MLLLHSTRDQESHVKRLVDEQNRTEQKRKMSILGLKKYILALGLGKLN
jgi:hypothetical protein